MSKKIDKSLLIEKTILTSEEYEKETICMLCNKLSYAHRTYLYLDDNRNLMIQVVSLCRKHTIKYHIIDFFYKLIRKGLVFEE